MTTPTALAYVGVTREFPGAAGAGRVRALHDFSLEAEPGTIIGLLGPNGSGKSTALKIALGLLRPDQGRVTVAGLPAGSAAARRKMGYLPDRGGVSTGLTGREVLVAWGRLQGWSRARAVERAQDALGQVDLEAAADRRVAGYSRGMTQRLALAQAVLPEPAVLLLDEPFSGVDPRGVDRLVEIIQGCRARGATVLLASHLLPRVEVVCDRVVLLHHGRILTAGSPAEVMGEPVARSRGLDEVFRELLDSVS